MSQGATAAAVSGAGAAPSTPSAAGAVVATSVDHRVELFPGVLQSIAKVRRFVADSLDEHHPLGVVLDCSLIASEMATNAYRHADGSPFRVGVRLVPGRVRITVEDWPSSTRCQTAGAPTPCRAARWSGPRC